MERKCGREKDREQDEEEEKRGGRKGKAGKAGKKSMEQVRDLVRTRKGIRIVQKPDNLPIKVPVIA